MLAIVPCAAGVIAMPAEARRIAVDPPVQIAVDAKPIAAFSARAPEQGRFDMVEYLGGLELKSSHSQFGGFSAIRVGPDGVYFVSLRDKGWWLTGRIVYQRSRPVGIADPVMAPMLGPDGRTLAARGWFDTESLAERDGSFYVGIERVNRIVRFDFAREGVLARAEVVSAPGISHLPYNKGLEALAFAPRNSKLAGALIGFSERGLDAGGNLKAFLIGGAAPGEFSVKRRDDFDISDSVTLPPSGDVLLLERRVSWWTGIAMRLRRIAIGDIAPHALVDRTRLPFADLRDPIGYMVGLSVHVDQNGETVLTLIFDDNFWILQRTVLLQFKLVSE